MLIFTQELEDEDLIFNYQSRISPMRDNGSEAESFINSSTKKAGVLLLVYPKKGDYYIALTQRHNYEGAHSGQISLPGGKLDQHDNNLLECSLRETLEEIGVPVNKTQVTRKMKSIYIPPSNFYVQPFLAILDVTPKFDLEKREVKELIEINIQDLDNKNVQTSDIQISESNNITVPIYNINDKVIWGATATILAEFHALLDKFNTS